MRVRFTSDKFQALYEKNEGAEQYPEGIAKKFRQRIDFIKAAQDERVNRSMEDADRVLEAQTLNQRCARPKRRITFTVGQRMRTVIRREAFI